MVPRDDKTKPKEQGMSEEKEYVINSDWGSCRWNLSSLLVLNATALQRHAHHQCNVRTLYYRTVHLNPMEFYETTSSKQIYLKQLKQKFKGRKERHTPWPFPVSALAPSSAGHLSLQCIVHGTSWPFFLSHLLYILSWPRLLFPEMLFPFFPYLEIHFCFFKHRVQHSLRYLFPFRS